MFMGCANSKLDRLPAVSLCRDRCHALDDALRQSYALADAHVAYLGSLRALGGSLARFVSSRPATEVDSPGPGHGEMPKHPLHHASPGRSSSSSTTGSHIRFNSDSDYDDHQKLASTSSRLGYIDDYDNPVELSNPNFDRFVSISYQRSQPVPSSIYIQPIYDTYLNQAITAGSGLKPQQPAPPPPPPPSNSNWDFLNFFDAYSTYEQPLGISGRRVKTFNSDMDLMSTKVPTGAGQKKIIVSESGKNRAEITTAKCEKPVSIHPEKLNFPESSHDEGRKYLDDVMNEVKSLFEKASDSGTAVLGMLDNAKFRYRPRSCTYQVSTKVLQAISSSYAKLCLKQRKRATSSLDTMDPDFIVGSYEDAMVGSGNLTSILNKLYMWEKKLYSEVKDEEILRIIYSKKCKQLKQLIEKEKQQPGDAVRIESDYSLIKNLSTKLKVSLHVVESISTRITKLRDEELCSCLCQLIYGCQEMWSIKADCHRRQCQAIAETKAIDMILWDQKPNYDFEHLDEAMQVKLDLQNLELCFSNWMIAQKCCIKALDGWLTKCLSNELEESASFPESGVPAVFVVSRQWMHAIDMSWVMHVTGTMTELVGSVGWVCDDTYARLHAKAQEDKEMEMKTKALERKDRKMRDEICRAIKRGVIPTTVVGLEINDGELKGMSRVRPRLENMFEAMAKYSAKCAETYKELCKFCNEQHVKGA